MSRMDKYNDEEYENEENEAEAVVLSRVNKNQVMYDDVYFNRTRMDIDSVIDSVGAVEDVLKNDIPKEEEKYEEKSYSVNEYLEKAHENKSPDNLKRDIDDTAFREGEDEIRKLIASIEEKEESEDFFKDLKGDNEDTLISGKLKTDEFNDIIYENLKNDNLTQATVLDHVLSDKTVLDLEKEEEDKIDHTFEEILKSDNENRKKKSILPIIIFCILLFVLIVVIAIILIVKK